MRSTSWWSALIPAIAVGVLLASANLPAYLRLAGDGVQVAGAATSICENGFFRFTFIVVSLVLAAFVAGLAWVWHTRRELAAKVFTSFIEQR